MMPVLLLTGATAVILQGFAPAPLALITLLLSAASGWHIWQVFAAGERLSPGLLGWLLATIALWWVANLGFADAPTVSMLAVFQQLVLVTAFVAAVTIARGLKWRSFRYGLALLAIALGVWSAASLLGVIDNGPNTSSPFIQRNSLCAFLALVTFAVLPDLAPTDRTEYPPHAARAAAFVAMFFALFVIFISTSRGVLLALLLASAGFYWSLNGALRARYGKPFVVLILVAFLAATLATRGAPLRTLDSLSVLGRWLGTDYSAQALADAEAANDGPARLSFSQRLILWRGSLAVLGDSAWHGHGAGSFRLVYPAYADMADRSNREYVHNDVLQITIEQGWPGLALVLALVTAVIWRRATARRRADPEDTERVEIEALFWGLAAVAVHSMVTYNFYVPATLILIGFVLARFDALTRTGNARSGVRPQAHLRRPVFLLLIAVWVLVPPAVLASAARMSTEHARGVMEFARGDFAAADSAFARAMRWYPNADSEIARAHVFLAASAAANSRAGRLEFIARAERHIARAALRNPHNPAGPHARYLVVINSEFDLIARREAALQEAMAAALRLDPWYFPVRLDAARYQRRTGQVRTALATLEAGLERSFPRVPEVIDYFLLLKELRELTDDTAGVLAAQARIDDLRRLLEPPT